MNKKHLGSTFDSFLEEQGIKEEVERRTREKIAAAKKKKAVTKPAKPPKTR